MTLPVHIFAQNRPDIDSLNNILNNTTNDSVRVDVINNIAWKLKSYNIDTSIIIGKRVLTLVQKSGSILQK